MTDARYWLRTLDDGSITVHGSTHLRRRGIWTGPLTVEQVSLLPDYRICAICLSANFTLGGAPSAGRVLRDWKPLTPASGQNHASRPRRGRDAEPR